MKKKNEYSAKVKRLLAEVPLLAELISTESAENNAAGVRAVYDELLLLQNVGRGYRRHEQLLELTHSPGDHYGFPARRGSEKHSEGFGSISLYSSIDTAIDQVCDA